MAQEARQQISAYIAKDLHRRLKSRAAEIDMTMTDVIATLIRRWLEGEITLEGKEPPPPTDG